MRKFGPSLGALLCFSTRASGRKTAPVWTAHVWTTALRRCWRVARAVPCVYSEAVRVKDISIMIASEPDLKTGRFRKASRTWWTRAVQSVFVQQVEAGLAACSSCVLMFLLTVSSFPTPLRHVLTVCASAASTRTRNMKRATRSTWSHVRYVTVPMTVGT